MDAIDRGENTRSAPSLARRLSNLFLEVLPARLAKLSAPGLTCEKGVTIKSPDRLSLGKNVVLQRHAILHCGGKSWSGYAGKIVLEDGVVVGPGVYLYGAGTIQVGEYSHFGPGSMVMTQSGDVASSHRLTATPGHVVEPVSIGRGVWIGAGAVILGGTVLGDNCAVSPNSVVKGTFECDTTIGGNPARAIRQNKSGSQST